MIGRPARPVLPRTATAPWRLAEPAGGYPASARRPKLASGWRAEFVGRLFDDLLSGKTAIRIGNPASEWPLILEG